MGDVASRDMRWWVRQLNESMKRYSIVYGDELTSKAEPKMDLWVMSCRVICGGGRGS